MTHSNIDIHSLREKREKVLYVLLTKKGGTLNLQEICNLLVSKYKISESLQDIKNTLQPTSFLISKGLVHNHGNGRYEIMQKGIDFLDETVVCMEPQNQSANARSMREIFARLSGEISIVDPYFDHDAVSKMERWIHGGINSIKIITGHKGDLKKSDITEFCDVDRAEMRICKKMHDRYVFDKNNFFFLGSSINGIGNRRSYIFSMGNHLPYFKKEFDKMWSIGVDV